MSLQDPTGSAPHIIDDTHCIPKSHAFHVSHKSIQLSSHSKIILHHLFSIRIAWIQIKCHRRCSKGCNVLATKWWHCELSQCITVQPAITYTKLTCTCIFQLRRGMSALVAEETALTFINNSNNQNLLQFDPSEPKVKVFSCNILFCSTCTSSFPFW